MDTPLVFPALAGVYAALSPIVEAMLRPTAMATWDRWRNGGSFWNQQGFEYTLLWGVAVLYVLVHGGGVYSIDRVLGVAL